MAGRTKKKRARPGGELDAKPVKAAGKSFGEAEFLSTARKRLESAEKAELEDRENALEDLTFLHVKQWPDSIVAERVAAGRPTPTHNLLAKFVERVVGDQRKNRPSIKVRAGDSLAEPEVAKVIEGLARRIQYRSSADEAYDTAFESAISGGWGFFRIDTEESTGDSFEREIVIRPIRNPFSVYLDPASQKSDGSDARWALVTDVVSREEFEERWPEAAVTALDANNIGQMYDGWFLDEGIKVAEYWLKKPTQRKLIEYVRLTEQPDGMVVRGEATVEFEDQMPDDQTDIKVLRHRMVGSYKVSKYIISGAEILEGPFDWPTEHIPIVPVLGKDVVVDGKRYRQSLVKHGKDAQREMNYWSAAIIEQIALAPRVPWVAAEGQIVGREHEWAEANTTARAVLQYKHMDGVPRPERQAPLGISTAMLTERNQASDNMKGVLGIYDASLGNRSNETSGVAIEARRQQGDDMTFRYVDNLTRAIVYAGKILVALIPLVYDTEREIRILHADDTEEAVVINRTLLDGTGKEAEIVNNLRRGRYDVVVDAGPNFKTRRMEAVQSMLAFIQAAPSAAAGVLDLVAKASDWPGADEVAERFRKMLPPGMVKAKDGEEEPPPPPPSPDQEVARVQAEAAMATAAATKMKAEVEMMKAKVEMSKLEMVHGAPPGGGALPVVNQEQPYETGIG
ncbi:MAG: hypothetical protein OEW11_11205 [Nitrospirota bacterium]|nr:hypothetical protein [Nitrospirota bacterium]